MPANSPTILHAIRENVERSPDVRALVHEPSEQQSYELTFAELWKRVNGVATQLRLISNEGDRVVLLYPSGPRFVETFLGCILARRIAVPAAVPRNDRAIERTVAIVKDSGAHLIATIPEMLPRLQQTIAEVRLHDGTAPKVVAMESVVSGQMKDSISCTSDEIAFLQYTSGSTAHPKGVMVSNKNLINNLSHIYREFGFERPNCLINWLPIYHDMGLIGGILAPLYAGATTVLMSPSEFVQRPLKWLELITKYGGTISGGPNFAYDACVTRIPEKQLGNLDLSTWRIAFNGSEPIRVDTLQRFASKFARCGFDENAIFPCYGLAESTLLVTCRDAAPYRQATFDRDELKRGHAVDSAEDIGRVLVACGPPNEEHELAIVDPVSGRLSSENEIGEIWLRGPSVCRGYWNNRGETQAAFEAELAEVPDAKFLRTGDLGIIRNGQLYITGRLKNIVIIRGLNYACEDVEDLAQASHPMLVGSPVAAFSTDGPGGEQLVVAQEINRRHLSDLVPSEVIGAIQQSIVLHYGVRASDIVLVQPGGLPRTTSGKIQRFKARDLYKAGTLPIVAESSSGAGLSGSSRASH